MILGIGIDVVEIERVERLVAEKGEHALRRLFTEREVAYASRRARPAQHYAVRIAAKEAAFKAFAGNELARGIGWREIEVVMHGDGRPSLELHGRALERAAEMGVTTAWLTLTHGHATAAACVVLEGRGASALLRAR